MKAQQRDPGLEGKTFRLRERAAGPAVVRRQGLMSPTALRNPGTTTTTISTTVIRTTARSLKVLGT